MRLSSLPFISRLSPIAQLAAMMLLLAAILQARESRASCGDYVIVGGKSSPSSVASPRATPSPSTGAPNSPMQNPTSHLPCHGPNCSSGLPPVPVAPSLTLLERESALLTTTDTACEERCNFLFAAFCAFIPHGILLRVFRPPRPMSV